MKSSIISMKIPMKSHKFVATCHSVPHLFTLAPQQLPERPHIGPKLPIRPLGCSQEGPLWPSKLGSRVEIYASNVLGNSKHQILGFYSTLSINNPVISSCFWMLRKVKSKKVTTDRSGTKWMSTGVKTSQHHNGTFCKHSPCQAVSTSHFPTHFSWPKWYRWGLASGSVAQRAWHN
jgi:hypothetical protein